VSRFLFLSFTILVTTFSHPSAYKAAALALTFVTPKMDGVTSTLYRFHFIAGFFIPSILPGANTESLLMIPTRPYTLSNFNKLPQFLEPFAHFKMLQYHKMLRLPSYKEKKKAEDTENLATNRDAQYTIIVSGTYQTDCMNDDHG
jgi:hypothetical protein